MGFHGAACSLARNVGYRQGANAGSRASTREPMGRVVFGIFPMGPIVTGFDTFANGKGVVSEVLMFTGDVRGGFMVPAAVRGYLEGRGYLSGHLDAMDGQTPA